MPYTDVEYQALGLTPDEVDALSEAGTNINLFTSVKGIDQLAALYEKAGLDGEAARIRELRDDTITSVQNAVYSETGFAVAYNDTAQQYYKIGGQGETSGQFVGSLEVYRRVDDADYGTTLRELVGYNPIVP